MILAIDNGVSGSIACLNKNGKVILFLPTPVKKELNYTKEKAWLNRLDHHALKELLFFIFRENDNSFENISVYIERPMINPMRWKASMSAIRCLEALVVVLEEVKLPSPTKYIDSKEWQKTMLPSGLKGADELKRAGVNVAERMFPGRKFIPDADALLMAEYLRRKENGEMK